MLKDKIISILQKDNQIQIVDEIWVTPVAGYWLKQDCYRWEGCIKGLLNDKTIRYTIESYDTIRDSVYRTLDYEMNGTNTYYFYTDK